MQRMTINTRRWILAATAGVVLFVGLIWVSGHSYIEVTVAGEKASFAITNQADASKSLVNEPVSIVKKLVKKGSYQITARAVDRDGIGFVRAGGFLSTTTKTLSLQSERSRTFVGDNPSPCMIYSQNLLHSYECGGVLSEVQTHQPANPSQPTFTKPNAAADEYSLLQSTLFVNGSILALIKNTGGPDSSSGAGNYIYTMGSDLALSDKKELSNLSDNTTYAVKSYKEGYVVYNSVGSKITATYHGPGPSQTSDLKLQPASDKKLAPLGFDALGDRYAVMYANNVGEDTETQAGNVTELVITSGGKNNRYEFDKSFEKIFLCGKDKLCTLSSGEAQIFDTSGKKAKLLYGVKDVAGIHNSSVGLVVVRSDSILEINADTGTGSTNFSLDSYRYCGYASAVSGYVLCLVNRQSEKVALYIDSGSKDIDSIDKKIAALLATQQIEKLSINQQYIFITPRLGNVVYNSATGSYDYSQEVKASTSASINEAIDRAQIDRQRYTIINTSAP